MSKPSLTAACVRACALRGRMIPPEEWEVLSRLPDSAAIIHRLAERGTLPDETTDTLSSERSAHMSVIEGASGIARFVTGQQGRFLRQFIHYYDLLNIESLIHMIHSDSKKESSRISNFYDTGTFGLLRTGTLISVSDYSALGHALRNTSLSDSFSQGLRRYREDADPAGFIEILELAFFSRWISLAKSCMDDQPGNPNGFPLRNFFISRAVSAAVRLGLFRRSGTARAAEWLLLIAPPETVDRCLGFLDEGAVADSMNKLVSILLPAFDEFRYWHRAPDARGDWGLLDSINMESALRSSKGISFSTEFISGVLLRMMCQAREITVLLESRDSALESPATQLEGAVS